LQAEREALAAFQAAEASAVHVPEQILPRLGTYLLRNKLVSKADLERALAYQKEQRANGLETRLGQVLLQLKLVSREDLDRAITEQMMEMQAALQDYNKRLEQRVAERTAELQNAIQKLMELNQLKINFISNVSHELLTPLSKIKGYSLMLSDGLLGNVGEQQKQALQTINRSVSNLEQLIQDLVRFSSNTRGEIRLNIGSVDIAQVIRKQVDAFDSRAQSAGVQLVADIGTNLPPVRGDGEKLNWLMHQLIDNAVKFTNKGGMVVVGARRQAQECLLYVQDTGIGLPMERVEELFIPFHQLDSSSTRHFGGTGLGLAFAQRLAEAHSTKIEVQSQPKKGSTFSIRLQFLL
jgi:signal transduction histidine kinase